MWKALHQLAIPERLYGLCGRCIPWLTALSALLLAVGLVWGFVYAPADYQQGQSYRIMYLHVPAAMWSMGVYLAMAVAAFVGLVWQMKMADLTVAALAPVALFWQVWTFWVQIIGLMRMSGQPLMKILIGYLVYLLVLMLLGSLLVALFVQAGWLDIQQINLQMEELMKSVPQ